MKKKNKAAQELVRRRWAKTSKAERSAHMRMMRAAGGGRPRATERCYCGATSLASAQTRGFDCCKRAGAYPEGAQP